MQMLEKQEYNDWPVKHNTDTIEIQVLMKVDIDLV